MTKHAPPTAPIVYLAEAIDRAVGRSRDGYDIARGLADCGLTVYRPATTWTGGQYNPLVVERVNREMLYRSNVIIADLRGSIYTIGVPMEVEAATARGIPAVVVVDHGKPRSVALQANPLVEWADHTAEAVAAGLELATAHHGRKKRQPSPDLRIVLTDPFVAEPERAYDDDAGYDLITSETTVIQPGTFADIPTTVANIQLPHGTWGMITGRSSTLRKRGLMVNQGVIDYGWRGPLFAGAWNLTGQPVKIEAGERIAQLIILDNATARTDLINMARAEHLDPHPRGHNGFGSSGGHGALDTTHASPLGGALTTPMSGAMGTIPG